MRAPEPVRALDEILEADLALVSHDVRVRPGGRHKVVVADHLTYPRPRHPAKVEQAYAAVAKVVRAERRNTRSGTSAGERRAESVGGEILEHTPIGMPVIAGAEIEHGSVEQAQRGLYAPDNSFAVLDAKTPPSPAYG